MNKINKEGYEALKDRISDEIYSWDGAESGWGDDAVENVLEILDDFFWGNKRVQWENKEVEVKKDIEWLNNEIEKIIKDVENDDVSFAGKEDYDEGYIDGIRDTQSIVNQLDEPETPEVLTQEFIESNSVYASSDGVTEEYVHVDDLQNLLVPKHELPVIPRFVAEAIEEDKECGYDVYESIDLILGTNGGGLPSISDWVARNIDKYASAWLNGFTVEEEPLYRARLKVITDEFIASYLRTQSSDAEDRLKALEIGSKYIHEDYRHLSEFTEDELKRLDIWDSKQWELEELEKWK